MPIDREVLERLSALEYEMEHMTKEVERLEVKVAYYDRMAIKWGWFVMGMLTLGAMIAAGFDKVKEKLISLFLP